MAKEKKFKKETLEKPAYTPKNTATGARTTGGITGAGAKKVNPVYRNIGGGGLGGMFNTKNR